MTQKNILLSYCTYWNSHLLIVLGRELVEKEMCSCSSRQKRTLRNHADNTATSLHALHYSNCLVKETGEEETVPAQYVCFQYAFACY